MAYTTIDKGSKYFNTKLYAGTSTTNSVTGLGFQPDWVWIKDRDRVTYHFLFDVIRGATNWLATNTENQEATFSDTLTSFNSDGFTLGVNGDVNGSPYNFASWNWKANGAGVSNTSGSITSIVSANTTAGFSIVTYTGAGGASTVGHGLGVIPKMIILKGRSNNSRIWVVGYGSLGWTKYMTLNSTIPVETNNYWNNTTPTSSVFSIFNSVNVNGSGENYVAYCFNEIKGYSKFDSYTGNGSTDGPFVYTGFKPAWLMVKRTDSGAESWYMTDNKRGTYNLITPYLTANETNAEGGPANMQDYLSNGFKIRGSGGYENASGGTYIYMAFAENPFVSSTGIPTTAR